MAYLILKSEQALQDSFWLAYSGRHGLPTPTAGRTSAARSVRCTDIHYTPNPAYHCLACGMDGRLRATAILPFTPFSHGKPIRLETWHFGCRCTLLPESFHSLPPSTALTHHLACLHLGDISTSFGNRARAHTRSIGGNAFACLPAFARHRFFDSFNAFSRAVARCYRTVAWPPGCSRSSATLFKRYICASLILPTSRLISWRPWTT